MLVASVPLKLPKVLSYFLLACLPVELLGGLFVHLSYFVVMTTLAMFSELPLSEPNTNDVEDVSPLLECVVDELSMCKPSISLDLRPFGHQSPSASLLRRWVPFWSPFLSPVVVACPVFFRFLVPMISSPLLLFVDKGNGFP